MSTISRRASAGALVIGLVSAIIATGASAQTTTTLGSGSTTNGNAKAAAVVRNDPLMGAAGTGLTRGVSASTIKIGCIVDKANWPEYQAGLEARISRANKSKELPGGRKIQLLDCQDDGASSQNDVQLAQKLVQQDQVFALATLSNFVSTPTSDFLNSNQVPYVGWGFLPAFCGTRWGYGWGGCVISDYSANQKHHVTFLSTAGTSIEGANLTPKGTKVALQGNESVGDSGNKTLASSYNALGASVVYSKGNLPSPPPGDLSPFVNAILDTKPNLVILNTDFSSAPGMAAAMKASYKGPIGNYVAYAPGVLQSSPQFASSLNGSYVTTLVVPQELQTPYIKQEQKDLKAIKHAPNISIAIGNGYLEADALVSQLKAVGKNLNTKTWDSVINKGHYTYRPTPAGGPGQLEYPAMHFISTDCAATLQIVGTDYKPKIPFTCFASKVDNP